MLLSFFTHPRRGIIIGLSCLLLLVGVRVNAATTGDDVRCERFDTIYQIGEDGKRHAYPNEHVYFAHNESFDHVKVVSCETLSSLPLGSNIAYPAGKRLIKSPSVPTVYAVTSGGVIHALQSEEQAQRLFGLAWARQVDDIPEPFLVHYTKGEDYPEDRYLEGVVFQQNGLFYQTDEQGNPVEITDLLAAWQKTHLTRFAYSLMSTETRLGKTLSRIARAERTSTLSTAQRALLKKFLLRNQIATTVTLAEATETERRADQALRQRDRVASGGSSSGGSSGGHSATSPSSATLSTADPEAEKKRLALEEEEKELAEKRAAIEAEQLSEKEAAEKQALLDQEEKELAEKRAALEAEEQAAKEAAEKQATLEAEEQAAKEAAEKQAALEAEEKAHAQAEEEEKAKAAQQAQEEAEEKARAQEEAEAAEKARLQAEEDAAEKARAQALADAQAKADAIGAQVVVNGDTILYICPKTDVLVKDLNECSSPTP